MLFPKFIIEDDKLILMKVKYHKDIATDVTKVIGGGQFHYNHDTNTFTFSGSSHDFGGVTEEKIRKCIESNNVYSCKSLRRNITKMHKFIYNSGSELITLN